MSSKDSCFVEGCLFCRRISVLSKDVCFGQRISVLSKDFCFVEGCEYHPPLGAFGPLFFLAINTSFCVVEGCLFCQRISVLSKDVTITRRLGPSAPIFLNNQCFVPEALRPHPEGPGPALRDHYLLSGPRCRSEGKGREGSFREAGAFLYLKNSISEQ